MYNKVVVNLNHDQNVILICVVSIIISEEVIYIVTEDSECYSFDSSEIISFSYSNGF